jgi:hypothetical protein
MTNALATAQHPSRPVLPSRDDLDVMLALAEQFLKSGLLPQEVKSSAAALLIIQKGQELRIPPAYALSNIFVIKGKPTASTDLMLSLIYRDHGDEAIVFEETNDKVCRVSYARKNATVRRSHSFTMQQATAAGLTTSGTWKAYPDAMLRARCISSVARMAFNDSIAGMYTPEELGVEESADGDLSGPRTNTNVIDITPQQEPTTAPENAVDPAADYDRSAVRANYFKHAKDTAYYEAKGRAQFLYEHTEGRHNSLQEYLAHATREQARAMLDELKRRIKEGLPPRQPAIDLDDLPSHSANDDDAVPF